LDQHNPTRTLLSGIFLVFFTGSQLLDIFYYSNALELLTWLSSGSVFACVKFDI
jgi:hypothetical protein